jgi:hypothetical protein
MDLRPTAGTAALAGIWCSIGLVPFDLWVEQAKFASVLTRNLTSITFFAVFLIAPFFYLVIGRDTGPFSRLWFMNPVERAGYLTVAKRMLVWFVSAAIAGSLISMAIAVKDHLTR